jgi:hypothetical protein
VTNLNTTLNPVVVPIQMRDGYCRSKQEFAQTPTLHLVSLVSFQPDDFTLSPYISPNYAFRLLRPPSLPGLEFAHHRQFSLGGSLNAI